MERFVLQQNKYCSSFLQTLVVRPDNLCQYSAHNESRSSGRLFFFTERNAPRQYNFPSSLLSTRYLTSKPQTKGICSHPNLSRGLYWSSKWGGNAIAQRFNTLINLRDAQLLCVFLFELRCITKLLPNETSHVYKVSVRFREQLQTVYVHFGTVLVEVRQFKCNDITSNWIKCITIPWGRSVFWYPSLKGIKIRTPPGKLKFKKQNNSYIKKLYSYKITPR